MFFINAIYLQGPNELRNARWVVHLDVGGSSSAMCLVSDAKWCELALRVSLDWARSSPAPVSHTRSLLISTISR